MGTQDQICFKDLCYYHFKNGILFVNYNKSSKENLSEGDLLNEYAAIDTKTGQIIAQGENLYTGDEEVDKDIEKFMR